MKSLRPLIVKTLQKTKLNKLAHKIYYSYVHGFNTASPQEMLPTLDAVFEQSVALGTASQGDYYEFGVFKGYAFWYAQKAAQRLGIDTMRFFGFDSFAGLPDIEGPDQTKNDIFYKGQYACSKDKVVKNLQAQGFDWSRGWLIEGFFEDSLTQEVKQQHGMGKAAIALIDCDIYSSTVEVLNFLEDLVMPNTILIFDDWKCFDYFDGNQDKGQRKAFKEFLANHQDLSAKELFSYGLYGQVFLVQKQPALHPR